MLRGCLRFCRSHPVLAAAIIGAVFGAGNVIAIEIGGVVHNSSGGVLPLLWSSAGARAGQLNPVQTATVLLIELAGNVLVFALLFSVPVALVVALRRIFIGRNRSAKDSDADNPDRA